MGTWREFMLVIFFFWTEPEFELRALFLLGKCSST
jgi:hypothetical protein